jgi:hypothetical protein
MKESQWKLAHLSATDSFQKYAEFILQNYDRNTFALIVVRKFVSLPPRHMHKPRYNQSLITKISLGLWSSPDH